MDVNRQAWTAGADLLVHPSERYVGLRAERAFVQKGEPIAIDVDRHRPRGRRRPRAAGAPAGRAARLGAGRGRVEGGPAATCRSARSRPGRSRCACASRRRRAARGASLARVADEQGRENETELRVWVAGGRVPPRRDLEEEKVTLVPDRKEYRAGDVAKVLVLAPFAPAEGVLTLRRSGLLREERFTIAGGSHTLAIPIEDAFTPNVHVQVDLVGQPREGRGEAPRPAFASGSLDLPVPPVVAHARRSRSHPREKALAPGGETVLDARPCATPPAGRWRAARRRWWSWTRRCSLSPATASRTRSTSSTRGAARTSPTTGCARTSCSPGRRSSRRSTERRRGWSAAARAASMRRWTPRRRPPPRRR